MPLTKPEVHLQQVAGSSTPSLLCHACNARVTNTSDKFCRNCGVRILYECPQCKAPISPSDHFCSQCGARRPMNWRLSLIYGELRRNPFAVSALAGVLATGWVFLYMKLRRYL
ncbi:hypothetical protein QR680_010372 [Steinernema hermaphroditum]|uniref:DZANK-type domain-containing protein n=1 Tax=Steinernema hermaphroditum TaxID=289476 RepID=A0AA39IRE5_9BILA|nr:hypothetical protein QR680_010372 [Steinernema hermaphroditum]